MVLATIFKGEKKKKKKRLAKIDARIDPLMEERKLTRDLAQNYSGYPLAKKTVSRATAIGRH